MWKTHAFRRALGPLLRQLDAEYDVPADQVPLLINFLQWLMIIVCNLALSLGSNKMAQSPCKPMAPPSNSFHQPRWFSSARARHP
jgi:hypothetical protein